MKKSLIALAVAALGISSAFAGTATNCPPTTTTAALSAGVAGLAGVTSSVAGSSGAGLSGGSSQSGAQSLQTANVAVTSSTYSNGTTLNGQQSATIGAQGSTASQGFAYNLSTGDGTGAANMSGTAQQAAVGAGSTPQVGTPGSAAVAATGWPNPGAGLQQGCLIGCSAGSPAVAATDPYVAAGSASGSEESSSQQHIAAGQNQGAAIASVSGGNFGADVGAATSPTDVSVPANGNTVTTASGEGLTVTAGSIGGTYSSTSFTNGVYQNGNAIDFGGNSNQIATTISVSGPHGSSTTEANPALVDTVSGTFSAQSAINGDISSGNVTGINVTAPLTAN